MLVSCSW